MRLESAQMVNERSHTTREKKLVNKGMTPNQQALLKQLESYTLSSILLEPSGQWLRFDFTSTIREPSITVTLFNPTFFKFSRNFDDDGYYFVGEAALLPVEDGAKRLSRLWAMT